jgi:transcriptional regulator with XRE-family HTH domain
MNLANFYGAAIRQQRELLRLSQEELAARASIDRTYISGVERGARNPTLDVMQRISTALGSDLDVIFAVARSISAKKES